MVILYGANSCLCPGEGEPEWRCCRRLATFAGGKGGYDKLISSVLQVAYTSQDTVMSSRLGRLQEGDTFY